MLIKGKAVTVFDIIKQMATLHPTTKISELPDLLPEFRVTKTYWEYEFKGRMN
jgi:hypothetical protein